MSINFTHIIQGQRAQGVNIWINSDDTLTIHTLMVTRKKNRLSFSIKNTLNADEVTSDKIPNNLPVYLSIDGKGIIHKYLESKNEDSLRSVIPNASRDDIVTQEYVAENGTKILSFARKEKIDQILRIFSNSGISVLRVILGPFSVLQLANLTEKFNELVLPNSTFILREGILTGFVRNNLTNTDNNFNIDGAWLESEYLVPFCNAICHFGADDNIEIDYEEFKINQVEFKYKRSILIYGWVILTLLFTGLLINYIILNKLSSENKYFSDQIEKNILILNNLEKLKSQIKTREELLQQDINKNNKIYAYYLDRIVKELPLQLALTRFCISPPIKSNSSKEAKEFQNEIIIISGNAYNSTALDNWFRYLESYKWIEEISIRNYSYIDGSAKFEIQIKIEE